MKDYKTRNAHGLIEAEKARKTILIYNIEKKHNVFVFISYCLTELSLSSLNQKFILWRPEVQNQVSRTMLSESGVESLLATTSSWWYQVFTGLRQ